MHVPIAGPSQNGGMEKGGDLLEGEYNLFRLRYALTFLECL